MISHVDELRINIVSQLFIDNESAFTLVKNWEGYT